MKFQDHFWTGYKPKHYTFGQYTHWNCISTFSKVTPLSMAPCSIFELVKVHLPWVPANSRNGTSGILTESVTVILQSLASNTTSQIIELWPDIVVKYAHNLSSCLILCQHIASGRWQMFTMQYPRIYLYPHQFFDRQLQLLFQNDDSSIYYLLELASNLHLFVHQM